jgi:phosphomannomutase
MAAFQQRNTKILCLFDVDGTLTVARKEIKPEMNEFLKELRKRVVIGVVGGSDMPTQREQLGENCTENFDYNFAENGLVAFKAGESLATENLKNFLGEEAIKEFVRFTLHYLADIDIPIRRGTFIEYRSGMLNISPIGRNCSREERNEFEAYDKIHGIRQAMVEALRAEFGEKYGLTFSIGGQISFDVFPNGWDKTYCLRFLEEDCFDEIHFFGDKTYEGGNDYEIFTSEKTIGHAVTSPEDTERILRELFF